LICNNAKNAAMMMMPMSAMRLRSSLYVKMVWLFLAKRPVATRYFGAGSVNPNRRKARTTRASGSPITV
jgi:hypothetical protein